MHPTPQPDRRRLPPLNALRAFEAAARHESFHAAADELAVTPGAVAQHVKALEAWLKLPLFRRLPSRGVVLTQAGHRYAASVSRLLDELAEATRRLVQQDNPHVLTVSTIHSFAAQWLIPRLGAFRARNPGLDVRVVASNAVTDFAREEVDLVIRYGRGAIRASPPSSSWRRRSFPYARRRWWRAALIPCASPGISSTTRSCTRRATA